MTLQMESYIAKNVSKITGKKPIQYVLIKIHKPTVLVANSTESISNDFKEVLYGKKIMCWSHMGRKCDDRLARISDKEISANMRAY